MANYRRRTYGYTGENTRPKTVVEEGRVNSAPRQPSEVKLQPPSKFWPILVFILLFPFKILGWLWSLRPKPNKESKHKFRAFLGWGLLTLVVIVFLVGTILVAWASRDLPDPNKLTERKVDQSTKIYDRTGEHLLYEVFNSEKRTLVQLDQVPKNLINGVIATEDAKFYQHSGVDFLGWARAVVYAVIKRQRIGGTSTLTQQLVKNAILTNERSITRKIKEVILSLRLEQKYSKDQILQIYFNEIPYGSTNYGVEAAAESYFGKHVTDLDLQECATLAGLPQQPSRFLNDSVALKNRRDFVLERMFNGGYITRAEADKAQAGPLTLQRNLGNIKAPHFVLYVKDQLIDKFGEQNVDSGGYKVITTLDFDKQQAAENAVSSSEKLLVEGKANNAGLVALDPRNGQVLAYVGSRDFSNKEINGQFDIVRLAKRQPGSSFKPIIYSALFEKGYTPDTILWDVNRNFAISGPPYEPHDYDNKERGPVTIRQALQGSLNIPAVEALYLVGAKNGVDFAQRMGYSTLNEGEFGLSLVLGGGEVNLLEHTNAYAIFANNGVKNNPVSILRVEDPNGEILYEWKPLEGQKVLEDKITATISNVLSDDGARAYVFGAGSILTLKDRPVAAKTGTTNNYRDAWTVGYTPSLVAGVWVGNTDNTEMRKGDGGSKMAAPIWNKFMTTALKNTTPEAFPEPPLNDANKPILRGSIGGGVTIAVNKINGKIATSSTPSELIESRTYYPAHSILYYVNKDDPRGPAPTNPAADPQYQNWENAIADWVKRLHEADPNFNLRFEEPPTEYDDGSVNYDLPKLDIIEPAVSSTLTSRLLKVKVEVSAPSGINRVIYKVDDKNIQVVNQSSYDLEYYLANFANGFHTLYVTAVDGTGVNFQKQIYFNLAVTTPDAGVNWSESSLKISSIEFPKTLYLNYFNIEKIAEIKMFLTNGSNQTDLGLVNLNNKFNNQLTFVLSSSPGIGNWFLMPEVKFKDGTISVMPKLRLVIE